MAFGWSYSKSIFTEFAEHELKPTLFVYHDLVKATRNFHTSMKLGEGGFGAVYKVWSHPIASFLQFWEFEHEWKCEPLLVDELSILGAYQQ